MKNFKHNEEALVVPGPDNRGRFLVSPNFAGVAYGLDMPGKDGEQEFDTGLFAEDALGVLQNNAHRQPRDAFEEASWSMGATDELLPRTEIPICSIATAQLIDKEIHVTVLGDCRAIVKHKEETFSIYDNRPERWGKSMLAALRAEMSSTGKSFAEAKQDLLPNIRKGIELIGTNELQPWYFMPDAEVAAEIVTQSFSADHVESILLYNRGLLEGYTVFSHATGINSEDDLLQQANRGLVDICQTIAKEQEAKTNAQTFRFTLQNDIAAVLLRA